MIDTLIEIAAPLFKVVLKELGSSSLISPKEISENDIANIANLLSGRLVYLLRYIDANPDPVYPHAYGRVLASFVDIGHTRQPARFEIRAEEGWGKASQYACWYLSMLGLIKIYGGIGGEVTISNLGKKIIRSDYIRTQFISVFEQSLR